jgi:hypothetical protein
MKKGKIQGATEMKETAARQQARKVGGIWVDPMSFPILTE